jgi:hypothetical protein
MQTLTNDVREYYMRLLTTKCLNTAMLSIFMLGKRRCWNYKLLWYRNDKKRHGENLETNTSIISNFKVDILDKR